MPQAGASQTVGLLIHEFEMEGLVLQRFIWLTLSAALTAGTGNAQSNSKAPTRLQQSAATNGKQMYASYCASCNGVDGKGDGPVAASLKMPAADLTLLSKNNSGEFPDRHIFVVLQNGTEIPSHGTAEMPVWGPILGRLDKANPDVKRLRISNLIRYLKSIQAK
jgi:mono/diheme cytochrome c family protein